MNPKDLQKYISYFKDCYTADNREFAIDNFFSSKYEQQHILKGGEELVNLHMPIRFISDKKGQEITKTLLLFENDKELLYGTLFCLGKRKNFRKRVTSIVAPFFYYKASIEIIDGEHFLKIDNTTRKLNLGFLKTLDYKESFDVFYQDLEILMEHYEAIDFKFVSVLKELIEKHVLNLNAEELLLFPELKTQHQLKKEISSISEEERFNLVSASGIFISSKANNVNSVINELSVLEKEEHFSKALHYFFSETIEGNKKEAKRPKTPVLLNKAQQRILHNANAYHKSIIFGPPGTGKTYTISAIAQDYVAKGKSVLLVAKTDQALTVLENKLKEFHLGSYVVKLGMKYDKRRVLSYLRRLTTGYYWGYFGEDKWNNIKDRQAYYENEVEKLEESFDKRIRKEKFRVYTQLNGKFINKIINTLDIATIRNWEEKEWSTIRKYYEAETRHRYFLDKYLEGNMALRLTDIGQKHLIELQKIKNSFQIEDKAVKSESIQQLNPKVLTKALPIWLAKVDQIASGIPFEKELFDIAIVDESTQCDIASILPVLQRVKKVVVAGDTNQLRHVSFLSKVRMKAFAKKYDLGIDSRFDYRKKSLLDFVIEKSPKMDQSVLLDEHYRSLPDIISFSNKRFYDNQLRVMSETPKNEQKQAVFVEQCVGVQNSNGVNEKEVKAVIAYLKNCIVNEKDVGKKQVSTIGVLSPFRNQTDHLIKLIKQEISLNDIRKHKIRIGTPYHFQGEEKDIMLLSMAVSKTSHAASFNYLKKEDVFNVAITRARYKQVIFTSIKPNEFKQENLLADYLLEIEKNRVVKNVISLEDQFAEEVCKYLKKQNCKTTIGYTIAGLSIDVLVEFNQQYFGIDLIGYPGPYEDAFSLERYRILNRVGIQIFPLSYLSWKTSPQLAKHHLKNKIESLK